jgi:hypothetical protein
VQLLLLAELQLLRHALPCLLLLLHAMGRRMLASCGCCKAAVPLHMLCTWAKPALPLLLHVVLQLPKG